MSDEQVIAKLNEQINAELYSAYLYVAMAAYFESLTFKGFSRWMRIQAKEEFLHAKKIYNYILERRWQVKLAAIAAPQLVWDSPLTAFEDAFKHEQKVTGLINNLVLLAEQKKDYATKSFLQWFVDEQVEEEANADENVSKVKMAGDSMGNLMLLDREMGNRPKS
jgi:ferritin